MAAFDEDDEADSPIIRVQRAANRSAVKLGKTPPFAPPFVSQQVMYSTVPEMDTGVKYLGKPAGGMSYTAASLTGR